MEISALFRRREVSKPQGRLGEIRKCEAYGRLKARFILGNKDVRNGIGEDDLTVGDLVDIISLYLAAAETNFRGGYVTIARIIRETVGAEERALLTDELDKLAHYGTTQDSLDRTSPLYLLRVNLRRVIEGEMGEICHEPGGIRIVEREDQAFQPTGRYALVSENLQQLDSGKPIEQVFGEVGLPVGKFE